MAIVFSATAQDDYVKYIAEANNGNPEAQYKISVCLLEGKGGVYKNVALGMSWLQKAEKQNYPEALNDLGVNYLYGTNGIKQNVSKGLSMINKAAKMDCPKAIMNLGSLYSRGEFVKLDVNKSFSYFQKAADLDHAPAKTSLGICYAQGLGVKQDGDKAIYWLKEAVAQNDARGLVMLGSCYANSWGVEKDPNLAFSLYTKAAEQNYADGQNSVGTCYLNGIGIEKDYTQAFLWFQKAAEQNHANSFYNMGLCYQNGWGVERDLAQSLFWYQKAANNFVSPAADAIKKVKAAMQEETTNGKAKQETVQISTKPSVNSQSSQLKPSSPVDLNIPTTDKENSNTFAIVIGNERYKNVAEVPFAVNDAKIFSEYLEKTLGVPHEQIKLIENAGFNDIRIAVNWLSQAMAVCEGKGKAIVYYAGHGIPNESDNSSYLLPVDGIGNDPSSAYSLKDFYDKLSKMQAQSVTVFLDACFSGTKRENGMLVAARGVAIKVKPSAPKGKMVVFSAAQGDETAYPYQDMQHGLFTYFLLKKLQETKGNVTLGELGDYLKSEVKRQSFLKNNKVQTPMVSVATLLQNQWKTIKLK